MPTKDLWFLPRSGPGRQYVLDYEVVARPDAALAVELRMHRRYAAGEVDGRPAFHVVLAFSALTVSQLGRTYNAGAADLEAFLLTTAERAASCLDMRLPPPLEAPVPHGHVVWLSVGDYASERMLTSTLVDALG